MGTLTYSPSFWGRRQLHWPITALTFFALLSTSIAAIISGDPPAFPNTNDPRDQFVFRTDGQNPVSLNFTCPVTGSDPLTINWFRSDVMDNEFKGDDGSYVFPNITEEHTAYASGDGVEYYCTVTNEFGTIRSRTVEAFYADFKGFAIDGAPADPIELTDDGEAVAVEVIDATVSGRQQWVALQCELVEDSTPEPAIQWISRNAGEETGEVLTEASGIELLDGGQWLIMETPTTRITNKQYFCQVTNARRFETERGPVTYTLTAVSNFDSEPGGVKIYKPLTNRTVPRVAADVDDVSVIFGTAIASFGDRDLSWRLDNSQSDDRVAESGPVARIIPRLSDTDPLDDDNVLDLLLRINPTVGDTIELSATLTLLDPAVLVGDTPVNMGDVLSGGPDITYTCNAGGSNPHITFFHNGVKLVAGNAASYTISSPAPTDSGMYQCLVENESGSEEASWFLIVRDRIVPTYVTSYSTDISECRDAPIIQRNNPPIVLTVNVTADPCPTAVWLVDGDPALPTGYTAGGSCADYALGDTLFSFTLTITTLPNDPTPVSVSFANNPDDPDDKVPVTEVQVVGEVRAHIESFTTEPNSPIAGTDMSCLSAGTTVQFICEYVGYPLATVVFRKDLVAIDAGADDRFTQACNVLTITGVMPDDEGSYDCTVENMGNSDDEESRSEPPLKLEYCITPTIQGDLTFTNKNPTEGDETTASCEWTGSPDPIITWIKDGTALDEKDLPSRFRITEGETESGGRRSNLEIDGVQLIDTGDYSCNVSNAVGFAVRFNRMEVQEATKSLLSETLIIGIAAGGGGFLVLVALVVVLLCCVWHCARRGQEGSYAVDKLTADGGIPLAVVQGGGGPQSYNVDYPDGPEEPEEPFNPDYASLPALRPAQPPQYKPTPNYPSEMPPPDGEYQKRVPSEDDFVGPYGHDNGGMHHQHYQPTVDDFVSDDAQFV